MSSIEELLIKHRGKNLILDTNILLLYIIGLCNENKIADNKLTRNYTSKSFQILSSINENYKLITTSNILTETSNLLKKNQLKDIAIPIFKYQVNELKESKYSSRYLIKSNFFDKVGLTDVSIYKLAQKNNLILTDDGDLFNIILSKNRDAIKFTDLLNVMKAGYM